MNIRKTVMLFSVLTLGVCSAFSPAEGSSAAVTNVALLKYKKVAVIKFHNPKNEQSGQEAADILALEFVKYGFNVVAGNQVNALIDQNELYASGMNQEIKTKLKSFGIDSVVTGTVPEFSCTFTDSRIKLITEESKNHCSVTVIAKMIDLDSGEIVWGNDSSGQDEGRWVTAESILRAIVRNMQETVPNVAAIRSSLIPARK